MASEVLTATFPLNVKQKNGKVVALSGSWYRNAHFFTSNNIKKHYTEKLAEPQLKSYSPIDGVVFSLFVIYKPNKRRLDTDNYTTVHKKFFNDAMTKYGIIEDDNTDHSPFQISVYGGIDKDNPRVDIYVSQDLEIIINLAREKLWTTN